MRTVELGRTGLRVSELGLGLASVGGMFAAVPERQAVATIDRAWELGVRLFDTAPVYGYGLSEQRAGLALRGRPRDEFVLSTKVGRLIEPGGPDLQPIWAEPPAGVGPRLDYSYGATIRSFEASLERMGIDRIDVLHIHDPELDFLTASTEAFRALVELRGRGTIRAISLGVNHTDVAARFLRESAVDVRGVEGPDVILLAGRYSLLDQSGADELLPLCEKLGVAVIAAGVFHGGVLADTADGAPHGYERVPRDVLRRIDVLRELCSAYGVPLLAAAVQFPLTHPAVPAVVVGARSPREIAEVAAWHEYEVPEAFWTALRSAL
ncbi:aldo/keto reductase [Kribbella soli]|uniref:Aldo/keto reductase n=1 Tax=Kribbella soli TaxID=1124743 RepID=A0A4R0H1H1_9ACTN|nr:aldo/keto reductase [Kribbella soli]TCC04337.1 aldo/keto reductase [Kribbella soli]